MSKKNEKSLVNGLVSTLTAVPLYPISYVKVLMQIGFEPLAPYKSKNFLGRDQFFYPNAISYIRHVKSVEGFTGLYGGLGMKIISNSIGTFAYTKLSEFVDEYEDRRKNDKHDENEKSSMLMIKQTSKEITVRCCAVVISHPFHVMALRCIAQFVGGESNYSSWNVFQNIAEINNTQGLKGFFSGLIPRLIFEASTIAITNTIVYLIKTYVFEEKELDVLVDLFASLLSNTITYPMSVVSTVSCISGSDLIAAKPPMMPIYTSWIDVFRKLIESNQLKRGSSSFFRIYLPPIDYSPQGTIVAFK